MPASTGGTFAAGVNGAGDTVGAYSDSSGQHGFVLSGGAYTPLDYPGATGGTTPFGINGAGQVVGDHVGADGIKHAFVYAGGAYTPLDDYPGTYLGTSAGGINGAGVIAGTYTDFIGYHGFLATPAVVPEPSPLALAALGLSALALFARRRGGC